MIKSYSNPINSTWNPHKIHIKNRHPGPSYGFRAKGDFCRAAPAALPPANSMDLYSVEGKGEIGDVWMFIFCGIIGIVWEFYDFIAFFKVLVEILIELYVIWWDFMRFYGICLCLNHPSSLFFGLSGWSIYHYNIMCLWIETLPSRRYKTSRHPKKVLWSGFTEYMMALFA